MLSECKAPVVAASETMTTSAFASTFDFIDSEMLMPVLEKAQRENKAVFVDFYTSWCLPCKLMEDEVFQDDELGEFFNDNFINYRVEADKGNGRTLASLYEIKMYPTLLFLDGQGNVLVRKDGAAFHTEIKELAELALNGGNQN